MANHGVLLTIDGGNSTIDCRAGDHRLVLARAEGSAELAAFAQQVAADRAIAVTVVEASKGLIDRAMQAANVALRFAGVDIACPLRMAYKTPETLGADRWVGALAAHREFGRSVIVDCGTATTVNLVDEDGTFCGGAIAPGLAAFAAGMAAVTPALPAPNFDGKSRVPALSTQEAVDTGVLLGYAGLVERLVADSLRASAGPAKVVITGGNAVRALAHSRLRATLVPDLVHRGLVLLDSQS